METNVCINENPPRERQPSYPASGRERLRRACLFLYLLKYKPSYLSELAVMCPLCDQQINTIIFLSEVSFFPCLRFRWNRLISALRFQVPRAGVGSRAARCFFHQQRALCGLPRNPAISRLGLSSLRHSRKPGL